jgi:Ca2+/Na+ antiporter
MSGPTQIGLGYSGMVTIVYLATDSFRNKAPFIFTLPVAFLGIMTLTTRMAPRHKIFTTLYYFVMGKE